MIREELPGIRNGYIFGLPASQVGATALSNAVASLSFFRTYKGFIAFSTLRPS